ncbi:hypothetical protein GII76_01065 [Bacillus subtilis]|uniref:XtrA/YqaO family protein n=1 Tax=Bacillus TaxID=1386 RepID=UPI000BAEF6C4|nr:XtrA/YqaO family protein [Bacillus subtilis]ASZ59914.1 hypothetical protein CLD04_01080 [Bacillus subtilis]QGH95029.1 hypothetical protein GII76_01065 [Bacillus subtilis]QPD79554.1 hypothetical protein GO005_01060 [Bacillus subtilis]UNM82436.1 hypothetical protein MNG38_01070 [Bacillus subtilis]
MNRPIELENIHQLSVGDLIERNKIKLVILDGQNGCAYLADTPEYGITTVHTTGNKYTRIHFDYGYKP